MRAIPSSELIINADGSIFHLHLRPEHLADTVILVGDPGRVAMISEYFDEKECEIANREFLTVTGKYKGKRMTVMSTGIGIGNITLKLKRKPFVHYCDILGAKFPYLLLKQSDVAVCSKRSYFKT